MFINVQVCFYCCRPPPGSSTSVAGPASQTAARSNSSLCNRMPVDGLLRELSPGPLAPEARVRTTKLKRPPLFMPLHFVPQQIEHPGAQAGTRPRWLCGSWAPRNANCLLSLLVRRPPCGQGPSQLLALCYSRKRWSPGSPHEPPRLRPHRNGAAARRNSQGSPVRPSCKQLIERSKRIAHLRLSVTDSAIAPSARMMCPWA